VSKTIPFRLITPTAIAFEGDAELVIAVGTEGEEGILPSHAPFLTALRPGILRANVVEGEAPRRVEFATSEGFMQALPDRLTILVDDAVPLERVDPASAHAEREAALVRQRELTPQTAEYAREQAIVDFADAKLALARSGV
jgi:F-type H+-transporting ATPase subunit epsilon